MQQPRRERKRQSRDEEVVWHGGLGRDEWFGQWLKRRRLR